MSQKEVLATKVEVLIDHNFTSECYFKMEITNLPQTGNPNENAACALVMIHDAVEDFYTQIHGDGKRHPVCQTAEALRKILQASIGPKLPIDRGYH